MRALLVIALGLIVGYYAGAFACPLAIVNGSAGQVNTALRGK